MYDWRAIMQTYFETYTANGGDTVKAKLAALDKHKVLEKDRANVASQISGSQDWDKISEIRTETKRSVRKRASYRQKHQKVPESILPPQDHMGILLAECAILAHEANEDVCPVD